MSTPEPIIQVPRCDEDWATRDDAARFLAHCIKIDPAGSVLAKDLYAAYRTWCLTGGKTPESKKAFGAYIRAPRRKSNGAYWIDGITWT